MEIKVSTNFPQVQKQLDALQREISNKATARALNATIAQAKTAMSKEIRQEFNVSAATVRDRLKIKRASFAAGRLSLEAALYSPYGSGERRINLIRFSARQTRRGVSVKIKKAGGRKTLTGTFIANKGRTVFERMPGTKMASRRGNTKHSEKIKAVQTLGIAKMFNTKRITAAVVAMMNTKFPIIFDRELAYALRQFNK